RLEHGARREESGVRLRIDEVRRERPEARAPKELEERLATECEVELARHVSRDPERRVRGDEELGAALPLRALVELWLVRGKEEVAGVEGEHVASARPEASEPRRALRQPAEVGELHGL